MLSTSPWSVPDVHITMVTVCCPHHHGHCLLSTSPWSLSVVHITIFTVCCPHHHGHCLLSTSPYSPSVVHITILRANRTTALVSLCRCHSGTRKTGTSKMVCLWTSLFKAAWGWGGGGRVKVTGWSYRHFQTERGPKT